MTQYVINIGAIPNDGTGDPLRTAFNETNLNFDQVFAAGPVLSNVRIANNTILTTTTNGNLILAPNGIGRIQANATVVPSVANVRDLGSATQRWNTVYTQYLDLSGSLTTGDLTVDGNLTVQGNIIQVGNIVTETLTIQLANAASTANAANGSGITVGANDNIARLIYNSTGNTWTTNIGLSSVGNISAPYLFGNGSQLTGLPVQYGNANVVANLVALGSNPISTTGNISGGFIFGNISQANGFPATYANANVLSLGEAGWAGNIVPSGNAVYSLGNATNQWNDLYVSNATIFMNNVPITLGEGNVLAVNGNAVLQNNSNTSISTTGNVTSGNLISSTLNNSGNISVVASGNTWTFGSTGNLTVPATNSVPGRISTQTTLANEKGFDLHITAGNTDGCTRPGGDLYLSAGVGYNGVSHGAGNVNIVTGDRYGNIDGNIWNFGSDGNLTLPGNIIAINYADGNRVTGGVTFNGEAVIGTGTSNTQSGLYLAPDPVSLANDLYLRVRGNVIDEPTHIHFDTGNNQYYNQYIGDDNKYIQLANTGNIVVNSNDAAGNSAQWIFNNFGTLSLPGGSRLSPLGANLDIFANGGYVNLITADESSRMGVSGAGGFITTPGGTWQFDTTGNLSAPGNVSAVGNVTGGNILTGGLISATGNISANNLSLAGNVTSSIGFTGATIIINNAPGGNEGAEIQWALPSAANTVLSGTMVQDVFQNGMRFFESSGNTRGLYMDLGNVPNGTATAVGYRDIPQVSFAANATIAATDAGRHYYSTSASNLTLTIANNTSVSWAVGTAITVVNRGSGNITVAQGTGVSLYLAGNSSTANRTVSTYGMATLINLEANVWMINGTGLT